MRVSIYGIYGGRKIALEHGGVPGYHKPYYVVLLCNSVYLVMVKYTLA